MAKRASAPVVGKAHPPVRKAAPKPAPRKTTPKPGRKSVSAAAKGRKAATRRNPARRAKPPVEVEKVIMRVRELDPRARCGAGTTVQRLFRVDAVSSGASQTHLVFLDRHGLYCEHGRGCPAVGEVTKLDRSLKRITQVG